MKREDQRFWNLIIYDIYATDDELDEMFSSPVFWIAVAFIIVGAVMLVVL